MVEKFVDALIWVIRSVYLTARGASLPQMGMIVAVYGFVWGASQLVTGRLSDNIGRFWPSVLGMWICGAGIALIVVVGSALWWAVSAGIAGFGIVALSIFISGALLYFWGEETHPRLSPEPPAVRKNEAEKSA